jgi:hypothetical protein
MTSWLVLQSAHEWLVLKRPMILDRNPGLAFRSPMCRAKLTEDQVDRFSEVGAGDSLILRAFAQGDATQRTLAALAAVSLQPSAEPGPLDYVSPVTFAAWWRKQGTRVGVLHCEPTPRIEWAE